MPLDGDAIMQALRSKDSSENVAANAPPAEAVKHVQTIVSKDPEV